VRWRRQGNSCSPCSFSIRGSNWLTGIDQHVAVLQATQVDVRQLFDDLAPSGSNEQMPPPSCAASPSPSTSVSMMMNEEKAEKVVRVAML
jgi:hypothetical protein